MSSRARIGIIIALAGIALAAVGIIVINRILQQTLTPLPPPTPIALVTEKVVITTRDIELGDVLLSGDLTLIDVPIELIPRDALKNPELVVGRFSKVPLVTGEMVLEHHLADPTNVTHDMAFVIGDDQVLMAFPANDLISSLNIFQRGDLVDILVSLTQPLRIVDEEGQVLAVDGEEETETKLVTWDAFQRVEIQAIIADIITNQQNANQTLQATPAAPTGQLPENARIRAYMLALNPQDALVLKHLIDAGGIFDMVLRAPTSTLLFDLEPVVDEYLIDRYQLELTR